MVSNKTISEKHKRIISLCQFYNPFYLYEKDLEPIFLGIAQRRGLEVTNCTKTRFRGHDFDCIDIYDRRPVRVELETYSGNSTLHQHNFKDIDLLVCLYDLPLVYGVVGLVQQGSSWLGEHYQLPIIEIISLPKLTKKRPVHRTWWRRLAVRPRVIDDHNHYFYFDMERTDQDLVMDVSKSLEGLMKKLSLA